LFNGRKIIASVGNPSAVLDAGESAQVSAVLKTPYLGSKSGEPTCHARSPGLPDFEHAEGVSPAVIDGSREEGCYARYLLLDQGQLQIAP
jgi:hypothetical protein